MESGFGGTEGHRLARIFAAPAACVRALAVVSCIAGALTIASSTARPCHAQMPWLEPEDGDLLHVSNAEGLKRGQFRLRASHGSSTAESEGSLVWNRVIAQYGLGHFLTLGLSTPHLAQQDGVLQKSGLGDTNLSLKLHWRPYEDLPVQVGLRQSISLPTGYEQERVGLLPFTSRQYDYTAQGLFQYDAISGRRRVSALLNPGVILPGGDVDSYATAGFGLELAHILPFGFDGAGEYYTRWSLVSHEFEAEAFVGVSHPLFLGFDVDFGAKRKLLQAEATKAEMHLGLSFEWPRGETDVLEVTTPKRERAALFVHPIECRVPDPRNVAGMLSQEFRTRAHTGGNPLTVYVSTLPNERVDALAGIRHYELVVRVLSIEEGSVEGYSIPLVLNAPRGKTRITAQFELIAPDGSTVAKRATLTGSASRGLGVDLVPSSGSIAGKVTPDEIKDVLREHATRDLAAEILRTAIHSIDERDAP